MRVGIIGYGIAGRIFHGGLLRRTPGAQVTSVVTRSPDRRAEVAEDFPDAVCRDDVADMLSADRLPRRGGRGDEDPGRLTRT